MPRALAALDLPRAHVMPRPCGLIAVASRPVEFAIPREMTQAQGIELARDFVRAEWIGA